MNIAVSVDTWDFDPLSSYAVISWVVVEWSVLPSFPLRSHMQYCRKSSGSSMKISVLL